ncbi:hypothetical protein [Vibrio breoganii]|uniref:hypothetical protein n=1 Tax=Vibrio breoganii TaxID=553239 RepID=UPI0012FFE3AE|nr:hypothetical protein [Vibrio breoganii]
MASRYISECENQTLALSKILNRVQDDACASLFASLRLKRIRHAGSHVMAIQYLR